MALPLSSLGHARATFCTVPRSGTEAARFAVIALLGLGASSLTVWIVEARLGLGMGLDFVASPAEAAA